VSCLLSTTLINKKKTKMSLICPITQEKFTDPVITPSGVTFERRAIVEWLRLHDTDPVTRQPLRVSQLVPNRAMRDLIDAESKSQSTPPATALSESGSRPSSPATSSVSSSRVLEPLPPPPAISITNDKITSPPVLSKDLPACNVVFLLDTSGSMGASATVAGNKATEDTGLTQLDVASHAVKACVRALRPHDNVALVSYSGQARMALPLTAMTCSTATTDMDEAIASLEASGTTNIYDAFRRAIVECLSTPVAVTASRDIILLLTDGEANVSPPRGEVESLKRLMSSHGSDRDVTIITIGFGKTQNEKQLHDLSTCGGDAGRYVFVSDAGMLATAFSHIMAGCMTYRQTVEGRIVRFGVDVDLKEHEVPGSDGSSTQGLIETISELLAASTFGLNVDECIQILKKSQQRLTHDDDIANLSEVANAVSRKDWFDSWGRRYLLSLRAALQQRCGYNARDVSTLRFADNTYNDIVEQVITAFENLPAPQRKQKYEDYGGYGGYGGGYGGALNTPVTRSIDMSAYNDLDGGCFSGDTLVLTPDGVVRIDKLRIGANVVATTLKNKKQFITKVKHVLVHIGSHELYQLEEHVSVTAWHPVLCLGDSTWRFPVTMATSTRASKMLLETRDSDSTSTDEDDEDDVPPPLTLLETVVYNLVLEDPRAAAVVLKAPTDDGGVVASVLGHGDTTSPVIGHGFFGDRSKLLDSISRLKQNEVGQHIIVKFARDAKTALVTNFE